MKKGSASQAGGLDIAAFVLGILSVLLAFLPWGPLISILFGIIGLVLGFMQKRRGQTKLGRAGIILSIIGIVLSILAIAVAYWYLKNNPEILAQLQGVAP